MALSNQSVAIIEKFKQDRVAATIPTPLATYLYIYTHSWHDSYINYMEGAKALATYLAPIDIPIPAHCVPDILVSYELIEIAKLILPHTVANKHIPLHRIENSIYEYLTQLR